MRIPLSPLVFGILVLLRFAGLMATCPLLGMSLIPWRIRIALGLATTCIVIGNLDLPDAAPNDLVALGLLGAAEVLVGMAVGLIVAMLVHGVRLAGQVAGIQIGLGFAQMLDPLTGDQSSVMSRLLGMVALLVILGFNGHHILIKGLALSFRQLPPGHAWPALFGAIQAVPAAGVTLFATAALVAAPALATVFCIKVAMAVMARAAPQIHVLAIGFIVTIVVGFLAVAWSLPGMGETIRAGFEQSASKALAILAGA